MAFIRYLDSEVASVYTVEADSVVVNGQSYTGAGKYEGKVINTIRKAEQADMDAFVVDTTVPDTAVGKTITITHPDGSVHAYTVAGIMPQEGNTVIEVKGGDPGFNIFEDGSSRLLFYPQTSWNGDHTFKIAADTVIDTGIIVHRTKQAPTYYTAAERQNAINNVNQGYSWALDMKNSAVAAADIYAQMSFDDIWNMVTPESINNGMDTVLRSLIDAYLYTGDAKYGEAGMVLLDRIADIYTEMEFSGTIEECTLEQTLVKAYDAFYPAVGSPAIKSFLSAKADAIGLENPKAYSDWICKNIEDRILRQVRVLSENPQMADNFGDQQVALALAAVVLDNPSETTGWLDFVFNDILPAIVNRTDRDGMGNETSLSSNRQFVDKVGLIADALDGYANYTKVNLYQNPAFIKMLTAYYPMMAAGKYTIQPGESGSTGVPEFIDSLEATAKCFEETGDPVFAQLTYYLNNNSASGLHYCIFTNNPNSLAESVMNVITTHGELELDSTVLSGYDLSILREGMVPSKLVSNSISFNDMTQLGSNVYTKYCESNGATQLEATGNGSYVTYEFTLPEDGDCVLAFTPYKAYSYGIYDIYVDDTKVATYDFYGSTGVNSGTVVISDSFFTAGAHTLKFVCIGKNASSTKYKMGLLSFITTQTIIREDTRRDVWMYYGKTNTSTSHPDQLNLGIHEYGLDMAPDLGISGQLDGGWASSTLSHNTVVVDNSSQLPADGGDLLHFDNADNVQVMDVESADAYAQTEMYRRSVVTVKVSDKDSYNVDFFRVKGGTDQTYSFHGTAGTVSTEGLNLVAQTTGATYQWLENERKDANPSSSFSVDYDITDELNVLAEQKDLHLRLTMLGEYNDVTVATGYAPNNGGVQSMEYVLTHANTTGSSLECVFTSVIEPYKDSRYIQSIEEAGVTRDGVPVSDMEARAVRVTLASGRVDYIVSALDNTVMYNIDGKFDFSGIIGVYSEIGGTVVTSYVNDGTVIGDQVYNAGAVTGTVTEFTRELALENRISVVLDSAIDASRLAGKCIYVENDGLENGVYQIKGIVSAEGNNVTLDLGTTSLIRSYADSENLDGGFIYNIAEGSRFRIPLGNMMTIQ